MPRVTVLCTSYNSPLIATAILSVYIQTFKDWELLVMDDGSDDPDTLAALDACEWFSRGDLRVRIVRLNTTPDMRRASVRYATLMNEGAAVTRGEYITYLAGDDFYMPDRLERMVAVLDELDCGAQHVVYGAQRMTGDTESIRHTRGMLRDAYGLVDLNSVMHTRAAFDEVGGWQDTPPTPELWRCADGHFWRRLTDAGYKFLPVAGGPTDVKRYRPDSVDQRVIAGLDPWT